MSTDMFPDSFIEYALSQEDTRSDYTRPGVEPWWTSAYWQMAARRANTGGNPPDEPSRTLTDMSDTPK